MKIENDLATILEPHAKKNRIPHKQRGFLYATPHFMKYDYDYDE